MEDDKKGSMSDKDREMAGRFEALDKDDDDDEKSEKDTKPEKKIPKRALLFSDEEKGGEKAPEKGDEDNKKEKSGLFSGLLKKQDVQVETGEDQGATSEEAQDGGSVNEQFQEVITERLDNVIQDLESSGAEGNTDALDARAQFLENVHEQVEGGISPSEAIDDALQDAVGNMNIGAIPELNIPPVEDEPEVVSPQPVRPATTRSSAQSTQTNQPYPMYYGINGGPGSPNVQSQNPNIQPMNNTFNRNRKTGDVLGYLLGRRGKHGMEAGYDRKLKQKDSEIDELSEKLKRSEEEVHRSVERSPEEAVSDARVETTVEERLIVEQQEKQFERELDTWTSSGEAKETELKVEVKDADVIRGRYTESKKDPQTMTMRELLEVADHIVLDKFTLSELYRNHRIDAVNLRRVVIEFLHGAKHEQMLRRSLEAVEMHRELRNEIKREDSASLASSGGAQQDSNMASVADLIRRNEEAKTYPTTSDGQLNVDQETYASPEESLNVSNEMAILLGVITGVAITVLLFFLLI